MKTLVNAALDFGLNKNILSIEEINSGHINQTYRIIYSNNESYILQKLNKKVFKNPDKIMSNIETLCCIIKSDIDKTEYTFPEYLNYEGKNYIEIGDSVWRGYRYIENSVSYENFTDNLHLHEFGKVLGNFHRITGNADISKFYLTICDFHNTKLKLEKLRKFYTSELKSEFGFFESIFKYATELEQKNLPLKVTHNDIKCSNVLFNRDNGKCLTLIDFDTVMPGLYVHDFGDGARSGCLKDCKIHMKKFEEYCKGYFSVV